MKISASQYAHSWYTILSKAQDRDATAHTLLRNLNQAGKLKMLPEILRIMKKVELAIQGKTAVTVSSAHDLDPATIDALIAATLGTTSTEITVIKNPTLIGGATVRTENAQWDLTLAGQLNSLRNQLLTPQ